MTYGYWKNKNIFITGITGFLGSWLAKYLVDDGANVSGLIRDITPESNLYRSGYINKVNVVRGTLENYFILERAFGEYEIETVFHTGAQTIVEIANRNPLSTFNSNIKGTWNLLEACRRNPLIKAIVVASSDKAYGIHKNLPYKEETPLQGRYPYDVSKSVVDLISQSYFHTYGLPVCITRCGNFFGGGDLNFNRLIPGTIRSIFHNEQPIIRSDGSCIRDYLYIEDGVRAYLTLAEKMNDSKIHGQAFNFSNENQISVLQMVEKILLLTKSHFKPIIGVTAVNEIPHQYLLAEKAKKVLGWKPIYDIDSSLIKTIDWYVSFFNKSV